MVGQKARSQAPGASGFISTCGGYRRVSLGGAWAPTLTCWALLDALPAVGDALGHVTRAQDVALVA